MTQEIQILESQYHVAQEASLVAVRMLDEIRPHYIATKEGLDQVKVMTSLKGDGYLAQSEALEAILSSFEQAFSRVAEAYQRAELECRLADEAAKEC